MSERQREIHRERGIETEREIQRERTIQRERYRERDTERERERERYREKQRRQCSSVLIRSCPLGWRSQVQSHSAPVSPGNLEIRPQKTTSGLGQLKGSRRCLPPLTEDKSSHSLWGLALIDSV